MSILAFLVVCLFVVIRLGLVIWAWMTLFSHFSGDYLWFWLPFVVLLLSSGSTSSD